jgi:hypothetical protein
MQADVLPCMCMCVTVNGVLKSTYQLPSTMLQVSLPPLTQKTVAGGADGAADFVYDRV